MSNSSFIKLNYGDSYCNVEFNNLVRILKEIYQEYEATIKEFTCGYRTCSYVKYKRAVYAMEHFKCAAESLSPIEKRIIEKEFFGNPVKSKWFQDYMSKNAYYISRKRAYYKFLNYLKG